MSETSPTQSPLVIPRKAVVEGSITYDGKVVLEGTILGDIQCASLVVTERGSVDGIISANAATVMGEASGAIYANQVTLKTACSVTADIFHKNLALENGCYFEGKSRRVQDPLSLAQAESEARYASDGLVR
ncbi:MAG: polymer-forming cytoskeletal protein [Hyphomicrobium sp.]|uniref:bactofilin family protein n=1 Tax=Hyphomicrobium sp. TaxID=82 RepID=UPI003D09978C